jgi:hypothetical protein
MPRAACAFVGIDAQVSGGLIVALQLTVPREAAPEAERPWDAGTISPAKKPRVLEQEETPGPSRRCGRSKRLIGVTRPGRLVSVIRQGVLIADRLLGWRQPKKSPAGEGGARLPRPSL